MRTINVTVTVATTTVRGAARVRLEHQTGGAWHPVATCSESTAAKFLRRRREPRLWRARPCST
ncbi:hypothetical protein [Gemmata sp.]|uniref:hypothetical protein n=1 Tax=Gemmata sp. TaxID=1914242 RepID=UPI003F6FDEA5